MPRLLTAKEVASELGLTPFRVYELARLGLLPSIRLGRSVRFPREALENWLAGPRRNPHPTAS
jgi:excisionase family DNA binding protein